MDGMTTLDDFCHVILNKFPMAWENFLMILWGLWTRRNKKFHGQLNEKDANVEVMSKLLLMDYHKANQQQPTTTRTKATVRWTKPNGDYIKFNCDASWQKESGRAGLGFVARNACGDVLLSGARTECYASSPLEAEAKSLLWATNQAHNKGYSKIIFESDSLCLVNALQRGTTLLQIASIFAQIVSNSSSFSSCNWSFVKREGNNVAHSIATWALSCSDELILEGSVPECACIWATDDVLSSNR
ncbi:reverse transcriptase [Tanacetum coccineum]